MECTHPCLSPTHRGYYCPDCHRLYHSLVDVAADRPTPAQQFRQAVADRLSQISENPQHAVAFGTSPSPLTPKPIESPSNPHHAVAFGTFFHAVYEYRSHTATYYKYLCTKGHHITHQLHIPGGNIANPIAQSRATEVRRWIHLGRSPDDIATLIRSWRIGRVKGKV